MPPDLLLELLGDNVREVNEAGNHRIRAPAETAGFSLQYREVVSVSYRSWRLLAKVARR